MTTGSYGSERVHIVVCVCVCACACACTRVCTCVYMCGHSGVQEYVCVVLYFYISY